MPFKWRFAGMLMMVTLGSFVIFQGIRTNIANEKPYLYFLWFLMEGDQDPLFPSLDPPNDRSRSAGFLEASWSRPSLFSALSINMKYLLITGILQVTWMKSGKDSLEKLKINSIQQCIILWCHMSFEFFQWSLIFANAKKLSNFSMLFFETSKSDLA